MSAVPRRLSPVVLSLALLGFAGCAEDNESSLNKEATTKVEATEAPPQTQEEHYKRQQELQKKAMSKAGGYPGAR